MVNAELLHKVGLVVGGALIGASTSYFVTKKILGKKFDEELNAEVDKLKDHFGRKPRVEPERDIEEVKEEIREELIQEMTQQIMLDEGYSDDPTPEETREIVKENLPTWGKKVEESTIDWPSVRPDEPTNPFASDPDKAELLEQRALKERATRVGVEAIFANRDESKPFVITHDEFWDNEPGYGQDEVTYFSVCGTIIDDKERVIDDVLHLELFGDDFSDYFGVVSNDEYTVQVRNHKKKVDYTITKEQMSYVHFLAGEEAMQDMEEERRSAPRKMKADD